MGICGWNSELCRFYFSASVCRYKYVRRSYQPGPMYISNQIHGVWYGLLVSSHADTACRLCLSIPHADGRLLERGVEELLESKKKIQGDSAQHLHFISHNSCSTSSSDHFCLHQAWWICQQIGAQRYGIMQIWRRRARSAFQLTEEVAGTDILQTAVSSKRDFQFSRPRCWHRGGRLREHHKTIDWSYNWHERWKFCDSGAALDSLAMISMIAQWVHIGLKVKASIAYARLLLF
jgi:hypothetical protein